MITILSNSHRTWLGRTVPPGRPTCGRICRRWSLWRSCRVVPPSRRWNWPTPPTYHSHSTDWTKEKRKKLYRPCTMRLFLPFTVFRILLVRLLKTTQLICARCVFSSTSHFWTEYRISSEKNFNPSKNDDFLKRYRGLKIANLGQSTRDIFCAFNA